MIRARMFLSSLSLITVLGCATRPSQPPSPSVRTLTEEGVVDLMVGSSIQATRGSNSESMIERAKAAMADGGPVTLIYVEDIPDEWTVVAPATVGGGGAWEYVRERAEAQGLPRVANSMLMSIEALARHIGKEFDAVVRVEPSGATLSALQVALEMGVPLVDGCLSGRCRPEIQQQIPWVNGIPCTPAALVTRWGDTVIIDRAVDDYRAEDLARAIAVASGGGSSIAMNPLSGPEVRAGVIPGSLSEAILYGRTVREARAEGKDPIEALLAVSNGYKLFHGIVTQSEQKGERGFSWADVELEGINEYQGHTYRVFVKNENIVSWLDGEPDAMSPDHICNLDPETGDAITGGGLGGYPLEREIVLVGMPAAPAWRTVKGIEVLGPRHFGFDFDYVPIEELQKK